MPLPVTVYRWDDPGAPSIGTRKPSEILNILKKCLVDGYGTKQPAGWTVEFQNGPGEMVFRNSPTQGSGGFVKLWFKTGAETANDIIFMQNAPFIDSINPDWPNVPGAGFRNVLFKGESHITRWVVYATAACFYLVTYGETTSTGSLVANSTNNLPIVFVGDFESFYPWDVNKFITIGLQSISSDAPLTTTSSPTGLFTLNTGQHTFKLHETTGYSSSKIGAILGSIGSINSGYGTSKAAAVIPADFNMNYIPVTIGLHSSYVELNGTGTSAAQKDSAGVNTVHSNLQPAFRGVLPGLYLSVFFGLANEPNIYVRTTPDDEYHLMPQFHFGGSRVWLKMGEWYA